MVMRPPPRPVRLPWTFCSFLEQQGAAPCSSEQLLQQKMLLIQPFQHLALAIDRLLATWLPCSCHHTASCINFQQVYQPVSMTRPVGCHVQYIAMAAVLW